MDGAGAWRGVVGVSAISVSAVLVFPLTGAGTAVFLFATGLAILRARVVLPVWLGWLAIVASVAALVVPWIGLIEIGVWLILTSIAHSSCACTGRVAPAAT